MKKKLLSLTTALMLAFSLMPAADIAALQPEPDLELNCVEEIDASQNDAEREINSIESDDTSKVGLGVFADGHNASAAVNGAVSVAGPFGVYAKAVNDGSADITVQGEVSAANSYSAVRLEAGNAQTTYTDLNITAEASEGTVTGLFNGINGTVYLDSYNAGSEVHFISLGDVDATTSKNPNGMIANVHGGQETILVDGDIKGRSCGLYLDNSSNGSNEVIVTGTISGNSGVSIAYGDRDNTALTVWKIENENGSLITYHSFADDSDRENFAKNKVLYIARAGEDVKLLKADGTDLDSNGSLLVAKEGDTIVIKSVDGKTVTKAFNGNDEITEKNSDGNFVYTVKRGGGIDISIETLDEPKGLYVCADSSTGDVTRTVGNISPGIRSGYEAYGISACARDGMTATVNTGNVTVNNAYAYFVYGLYSYTDSDTSGHIDVTTGSITSNEYGINVNSADGGDNKTTVNGDITADLDAIQANAFGNGKTDVTVNGNVISAGDYAINMHAPFENTSVNITVNGDVTATKKIGLKYGGKADAYDVLITGTLTGSSYSVLSDTYYSEEIGKNKLTVWKIANTDGTAADLIVKLVGYNMYETDDDMAEEINYIVKTGDNVKALKADGTELDTSHGYPVAKENDTILIKAANGKQVTKAFNGGQEITTKNKKGNFVYTVQRGGGIDLTIETSDEDEVDSIPGDANHDGKVDVSDVLLTQQYLASWDVDIDLDAADYDGDGEVNVGDVLLTQQKIAGWYA